MRASEARRLAPSLRCVHVELLGPNGDAVPPESSSTTRSNAKVTLRRYRRASARVMAIFERAVGAQHMQRTSIDEAYLDPTPAIKNKMSAPNVGPGQRANRRAPSSSTRACMAWQKTKLQNGFPQST